MARQHTGWYSCIYNDDYLQWWNGSAWMPGFWPKAAGEPPRPTQPNTWPYFAAFAVCVALWMFMPKPWGLVPILLILAVVLYRWGKRVSAIPIGALPAIPELNRATDGHS